MANSRALGTSGTLTNKILKIMDQDSILNFKRLFTYINESLFWAQDVKEHGISLPNGFLCHLLIHVLINRAVSDLLVKEEIQIRARDKA